MPRKTKNDELGRLSTEAFKKAAKIPIVIILDDVRSLNNVGSVFRTADAFLLESIYLCGITGKPPHREIAKTALGATDTVDWKYFATTLEAVNSLKEQGYKIIAIEQAENSIYLQDYVPDKGQKIALVFGNEVDGVSQEVVDVADTIIEIPQLGSKHSFNISVSVGIVVWAMWRMMRAE